MLAVSDAAHDVVCRAASEPGCTESGIDQNGESRYNVKNPSRRIRPSDHAIYHKPVTPVRSRKSGRRSAYVLATSVARSNKRLLRSEFTPSHQGEEQSL